MRENGLGDYYAGVDNDSKAKGSLVLTTALGLSITSKGAEQEGHHPHHIHLVTAPMILAVVVLPQCTSLAV